MSFNPSKYRISETAEYKVTDPKGDYILLENGQPWTITVASPGTKEAMRAAHERQKGKTADMFAQMAGKKSTRDEMDDIRDRAKFLVAVTKGTNAADLEFEGKTGIDALHAVYMDTLMGVAAGLEKFHDDLGNFYAG